MGGVLIDDDLTVYGQTTMNADLTLAGQIATSGASIYGNSSLMGNLHVDQSTTIVGDLTVNSGSNLAAVTTGFMTAANANVLGSMTVGYIPKHTYV